MSEVGLMFYMLLGYAQAHALVVSIFLVGAIGLNVMAMKQEGAFFAMTPVKQTLIALVAVFVVLMLTIPTLTGSSLAQVSYWLDWTVLFIMSLGYTAASAAWIYPVLRYYQSLQSAS